MADVFKKKFASMKADCDRAKKSCEEAEAETNDKLDKAEKTEEEAQSLFKTIQDLEDEIDSFESRYVAAQQSLEEAVTKKDEHTQVQANLTCRVTRDDSKITVLQAESEEVKEKNDAAKERFEAVTAEIDDDEGALEEEESRRDRLTIEVRDLEARTIEVGNELRSKQISCDQNTTRSDKSDTTIASLEEQLEVVSSEATKFEAESVESEAKSTELDDELEEVKIKLQAKQHEIEEIKNMINDI